MSGHTKGPWKVGDGKAPFYAWPGQVLGKHEDGSEFILASCNQNYPDEAEANAHLIAAAPELLEAVKKAHGYRAEPDKLAVIVSRFAEIIAKAEGKEVPHE